MILLKFLFNFAFVKPIKVQVMDETTVKDRLLQFLKAKGISKAEFARRMGVSETYVSTMRKSLPEQRVAKMTRLFPDLNRDWLLYGEGEMLTTSDKPNHPQDDDDDGYVMLLPVEAYAGKLQAFSRGVTRRECRRLPIRVDGADFAIQITGDSMEPHIHNGVIAILAKINERAFIPWGNPMVIDTENGVYVKVVRPAQDADDAIEASSYNPLYPPFMIPTESIHGIYRILCLYQPLTTM